MSIEQVMSFLKKEANLSEQELDKKVWKDPAYYVGFCGDIIGEEVEKYDYDNQNGTTTYDALRVDTAEQAIFVLMDMDQGKLSNR